MNKRGITPVISVVLLLMMTVAIAGIAWFWLQGMTERIMNTTEETADIQFGKLTFELDFGGTKVYCTDDGYIDMVSVFASVEGGTGVRLEGVLLNNIVIENDDMINLKIGDYLGTGEYKEIIINNYLLDTIPKIIMVVFKQFFKEQALNLLYCSLLEEMWE